MLSEKKRGDTKAKGVNTTRSREKGRRGANLQRKGGRVVEIDRKKFLTTPFFWKEGGKVSRGKPGFIDLGKKDGGGEMRTCG